MKKLFAITSVLLLAGGMATSASAQSRDYQGYQGYSNGYDQGDDSQADDNGDGDRNDGQSYDQYGDGQRQVQVDQYGNVIRQAQYDQYGNAQRQVQYDRDGNRVAHGDDGRDQRDRRDAYDNGHDRREFGHSHQARHRYQAGRYAGPRGYRGNRWNVGTRLPVGYYGSSYYLDARSYGLSYPSRGYRWNRVGNDAYLVSTSNGLIQDVIYSLFR